MLDKDKLLPLVEQRSGVIVGALNLNKDFASGYLKGMNEQRDFDFEQVKELLDRLGLLTHLKDENLLPPIPS